MQAMEEALDQELDSSKESTSPPAAGSGGRLSVAELKDQLRPRVDKTQAAWIASVLAKIERNAAGNARICAWGQRGFLRGCLKNLDNGKAVDYTPAEPSTGPDYTVFGIPAVLEEITIGKLEERGDDCKSFNKALAFVKRWLSDDFAVSLKLGSGLILCGDVGTGKSALAVAVVKHAIIHHKARGRFVRAAEMVRKLTKLTGVEWDEYRRWLIEADVLVIDDLGAEYQSTWSDANLDEIFMARHDARRSTIITSNLYQAGLAEVMDGRTWDRLFSSAAAVLEITGATFRKEPNWTKRKGMV